jgi:hypothetical protein
MIDHFTIGCQLHSYITYWTTFSINALYYIYKNQRNIVMY